MKLTILILAIFGLATASAIPATRTLDTRDLKDIWDDFFGLLDTDKMKEIVIVYVAEDEEVQRVVAYLQSDDFKALVSAISELDAWTRLREYLEAGGLNITGLIERVRNILQGGWSTQSIARLASTRITGGVAGLWADLKATLPMDDLRAMWADKLANDPQFADMVAYVKSPEAQTFYAKVKANETWQYWRAKAVEYNLDIDRAIDWLKNLVDWE